MKYFSAGIQQFGEEGGRPGYAQDAWQASFQGRNPRMKRRVSAFIEPGRQQRKPPEIQQGLQGGEQPPGDSGGASPSWQRCQKTIDVHGADVEMRGRADPAGARGGRNAGAPQDADNLPVFQTGLAETHDSGAVFRRAVS